MTFEELASEINRDRFREESWEREKRKAIGEDVYTLFCCWCNAYNHFKDKDDPKVFARFLQETETEINFWQKKHIAEKYFGYQFEYDQKNAKWITRRTKNVSIS